MAARKPGQPTKLTPELQAEIVNLLKMGALIVDVCGYVGISETSYQRWMSIGRAYNDDEPHKEMPRKIVDRERYWDFWVACTRARKEATIGCVNTLRIASQTVTKRVIDPATGKETIEIVKQGDPHAAQWYLERSNPAKWGKRTYLKVEGLDDFLKWCERKGETPGDLFQELMQSIEAEHASSDVKRD